MRIVFVIAFFGALALSVACLVDGLWLSLVFWGGVAGIIGIGLERGA